MNTYRLEPKESERFYPSRIREIIKRETDQIMQKEKDFAEKYSDEEAKRIATEISDQVRNVLKSTNETALIPRHKVIVQSVVGEKAGQGLKITSKSLWHSEYDNSATYTYETDNRFCTVMVFGYYCE
eukprot:TRINITY_DN9359_c0_g1_i24.p3 TRINITY_DN9359_c0_g1~~TRINITY_DN9359_c0_g1_i24.p3  ORF type:complete len:127 (-),score=50.33 TRINITY_DN9359_c0_g1_i24:93-473(-)